MGTEGSVYITVFVFLTALGDDPQAVVVKIFAVEQGGWGGQSIQTKWIGNTSIANKMLATMIIASHLQALGLPS